MPFCGAGAYGLLPKQQVLSRSRIPSKYVRDGRLFHSGGPGGVDPNAVALSSSALMGRHLPSFRRKPDPVLAPLF